MFCESHILKASELSIAREEGEGAGIMGTGIMGTGRERRRKEKYELLKNAKRVP